MVYFKRGDKMSKNINEVKVLPHSNEAEQALLGCIIQGGEREQEIAMAWIRDDSAFYATDNKNIWKSIMP